MLDFRVQTFLTVCRTLNYTQAARELNITQPAVSQHIAALERHYGAPLFVKEGKRPRLTEAGKLLQQVCITMVHDEQALQRSIEVLQPPPRHRRQVLVDHRAAAPGPEGPVGRHSRGQPALHKRRSGGSRRHRGRGPRKRGPNAKVRLAAGAHGAPV